MGIETLAIGSLAASAVGGATSAYGAIATGQANGMSADYAAAVARNNAVTAGYNADYALASGSQQEEGQQMKTKATLATQKSAQAANGIDVNSGTAVDVRRSTDELGHLDALTILNNAANKAAGFRAQQSNFTAEAGLDTMKGDTSRMSGYISGMGSLISSASSVGDKWLSYSQKGVFA